MRRACARRCRGIIGKASVRCRREKGCEDCACACVCGAWARQAGFFCVGFMLCVERLLVWRRTSSPSLSSTSMAAFHVSSRRGGQGRGGGPLPLSFRKDVGCMLAFQQESERASERQKRLQGRCAVEYREGGWLVGWVASSTRLCAWPSRPLRPPPHTHTDAHGVCVGDSVGLYPGFALLATAFSRPLLSLAAPLLV